MGSLSRSWKGSARLSPAVLEEAMAETRAALFERLQDEDTAMAMGELHGMVTGLDDAAAVREGIAAGMAAFLADIEVRRSVLAERLALYHGGQP